MTKQQQRKVANEFAPWDSDITKKIKNKIKINFQNLFGKRGEAEMSVMCNLISMFFAPFSAYSLHRQLVGHLDL